MFTFCKARWARQKKRNKNYATNVTKLPKNQKTKIWDERNKNRDLYIFVKKTSQTLVWLKFLICSMCQVKMIYFLFKCMSVDISWTWNSYSYGGFKYRNWAEESAARRKSARTCKREKKSDWESDKSYCQQ